MQVVTCAPFIGQMGNQLFQIANVIGYAKRHGMDYSIPLQGHNERLWPAVFKHLPNKPISPYRLKYHEESHGYNEIPLFGQQFIEFSGFFQSEKYFVDQRNAVIKELDLPWEPLHGYVGIHVRRGDYLTFPDKHPFVGEDYLHSAVNLFLREGFTKFIVCSDDIAWCKHFFQHDDPNVTFQYSVKKSNIADVVLLSCCEHIICSNSTFSWWGAWLNRNINKKMVFPSRWFGPGNGHLESKDIYPEQSIILPC